MKTITLFCALLLALTSCGSLYNVSSDVKSGGIPFFSHQMLETTTVLYEENFFQLELELKWEEKEKVVKSNGKSVKTKKATSNPPQFVTKAVKYASVECAYFLNTQFSSRTTIKDAYNAVAGQMLESPSKTLINSNCQYQNMPFVRKNISTLMNQGTASPTNIVAQQVSLTRSRKTVPNPKPQFVNVKKPITGSSEATITLNADGTLASAASKVQDDLVGTIIEKLPITEAVSSFIGIANETESQSVQTETARLVGLKFTLVPIKRIYEVSKENFISSNSTGATALPTADNHTGFKITETKGSLLSEPKKVEDNKQTIKLNGSIVLPKKSE